MPAAIHISQARRILDSHQPVTVAAWTADHKILVMERVVPLAYNYRAGTRNFRNSASGQIRKVREACIFRVNDCEVYL